MKKHLFIKTLSLVVCAAVLFLSLCACQSGQGNNESEKPSDKEQETVSATPTGRTDGMSELMHLYCNDRLYVQEIIDAVYYDEVSKNTELEYVGEVLKNDNYKIPTQNFASYMAEVGYKIYKSSSDDSVYLRTDYDRMYLLKPSE